MTEASDARPLTAQLRNRTIEVAGLMAILIVTGFTAYGSMDLLLWDETGYLARGVDPTRFSSPGWEDSYSYSAIYGLLSRVVPNPIDLYFVGRTLSCVLVVLGVYLASRINSQPLPALSAAGVMAVLPVTYVWPGVAGPAAFALVIAAGIVSRWSRPWALGIGAVLTWFAAASRPEFTWMALALSGWVVVWQVLELREQTSRPRAWQLLMSALGGIAAPLAVFLYFGNVLSSSPRQWTAFTQHFAIRNGTAGQDAWVSADQVAQQFFPTSGSITQAVIENPSAVAEHVLANGVWLPTTLVGHAVGFGGQPLWRPLSVFAAVTFIAGVVVSIYWNRRSVRSLVVQGLRMKLSAIVMIAMMIVAFVIPALAIYPRPHYLIFPIMLALFISTTVIGHLPDRRTQVWIPGATTVLAVGLAVVLSTQLVVDRSAAPPSWEASVRELQQLPGGVRIVSVDERICVYIDDCVALPEPSHWEKALPFDEYLQIRGVNAVLSVPILNDSEWGQLSGVSNFLEDPDPFGYRAVVPSGPVVIRQ